MFQMGNLFWLVILWRVFARGLLRDFGDRIGGMMLLCLVIEPVKENRHVSEHKILSHIFADEIDIEQPMNKMYSNMSVIQNQYTYERFLSEILPGVQKTDKVFLEHLPKKWI